MSEFSSPNCSTITSEPVALIGLASGKVGSGKWCIGERSSRCKTGGVGSDAMEGAGVNADESKGIFNFSPGLRSSRITRNPKRKGSVYGIARLRGAVRRWHEVVGASFPDFLGRNLLLAALCLR